MLKKRSAAESFALFLAALAPIVCHQVGAEVLLLSQFDVSAKPTYTRFESVLTEGAQKLTAGGRGRPLANAAPAGEALDLGYDQPAAGGLDYRLPGKFDLRAGALSCWIKSARDFSPAMSDIAADPTFVLIPLEGGGRIALYVYSHRQIYRTMINFFISLDKRDRVTRSANCVVGPRIPPGQKKFVPKPWLRDEWRHLAASWGPREMKLFLDGGLVAHREYDEDLQISMATGVVHVGWDHRGSSRVAQVLLDELMLANSPQDLETVVADIGKQVAAPAPRRDRPGNAADNGAAPGSTYQAPFLKEAPALDGEVLLDPVWQALPKSFQLTTNNFQNDPVYPPTVWSVGHDGRTLYVGAVCYEPNMAALADTKRGKDVWGDDAVELFFAPDPEDLSVLCQLVSNPGGGHYDSKGRFGSTWNAEWRTAGKREADYWSIEFAIPLTEIDPDFHAGKTWRFNFCRDRRANPLGKMQYASWSVLQTGSFHNPKRFNCLRFAADDEPVEPENWDAESRNFAREITKLIEPALASLGREVTELADLASRISADKDDYGAKAAGLKAAVAQVSEQFRDGVVFRDPHQLSRDWLTVTELSRQFRPLWVELMLAAPAGPDVLPPTAVRQPVAEGEHHWFLNAREAVYVIAKKTGMVEGVWRTGEPRRLVKSAYDIYQLEDEDTPIRTSDERLDRAIRCKTGTRDGKTTVSIVCENPHLPGTIRKLYTVTDDFPGRMRKRLEVRLAVDKPTLLRVAANLFFIPRYRESGFYHRLTGIGGEASLVPVSDVTGDVFQKPAGGYPLAGGWGQFMLCQPADRDLLCQYVWKINDKLILPPITAAPSFLTSYGWKLNYLAEFATSARDVTAEVCYDYARGDRLSFYRDRYFGHPTVRAMYEEFPLPDWVGRMRFAPTTIDHFVRRRLRKATPTDHEQETWRQFAPYIRSDETAIGCHMFWHTLYGDYPAGDKAELVMGIITADRKTWEKYPPSFYRDCVAASHQATGNRQRISLYTFENSIMKDLAGAPEEWYVHGKDGSRIPCNWSDKLDLCLAGAPSFIEKYLADVAGMYEYYGMDSLYIDGGPLYPKIDWRTKTVTQASAGNYRNRELKKLAVKHNGANWFNYGFMQPYQDIAFWEGATGGYVGKLDKGWRAAADAFLHTRLVQKPGQPVMPMYWDADLLRNAQEKNRHYLNLLTLYGWGPIYRNVGADAAKKYYPGDERIAPVRMGWRYTEIGVDLAGLRLVDVDMQPCWWQDWQTDVESYSYKQGDAAVITVLSHRETAADLEIGIDVRKAGIDAEKPVYGWLYRPLHPNETMLPFKSLYPEWYVKELFAKEWLGQQEAKGKRLVRTLPGVAPGLAHVLVLTQTPALVYAGDGLRTDIPLPEQIGVKITGALDATERESRLSVTSNKPCHIAAYWPAGWSHPTVSVDGRALEPWRVAAAHCAGARMLVAPVAAGEHRVVVREGQGTAQVRLQLANRTPIPAETKPGARLKLRLDCQSQTKLPDDSRLCVYLSRNGIYEYRQSIPFPAAAADALAVELVWPEIPAELAPQLQLGDRTYLVEAALETAGAPDCTPSWRTTLGQTVFHPTPKPK